VGRKLAGDERLNARWRAAQELSLGPFTIGAINRDRQFSLLHGAAKARVARNLEEARHSLTRSTTARVEQPINRFSPMALIERRYTERR